WLVRTAMNAGTGAVIVALLGFSVAMVVGQHGTVSFESDEIGKPPSGFTFALTGQGKPGVWVVQKDDAAHGNLLVQTDADQTDYRFPLAIFDSFTGADVS